MKNSLQWISRSVDFSEHKNDIVIQWSRYEIKIIKWKRKFGIEAYYCDVRVATTTVFSNWKILNFVSDCWLNCWLNIFVRIHTEVSISALITLQPYEAHLFPPAYKYKYQEHQLLENCKSSIYFERIIKTKKKHKKEKKRIIYNVTCNIISYQNK